MVRLHTSLLAAASVLVGTPALAQERAAAVDVPAGRLDQAIQILSRQSGVSIGFRDVRLASIRVRAVRGHLTAAQALERLLRDTDAMARQVATATFLIEAAPRPVARAPSPPRVSPPRVVQPAPEPPEPPPREIIVTGTKRDIPLGAYPGGVQIIDGDSLSKADGARGTDAIIARVASVASTHLGTGRNKLFVRGIADSSFIGPTQATVGQYWGNSRITYSAPDPSLRLYDIRSVEVLEGPQGTLYGAGSLGGVVRVVPRAPEMDRFGGAAWGGLQAVEHGKPGIDGGAILNLPITGDLAFRAVGFGAHEAGYIDDTSRRLDDVNKVTTFGGRAALRYAPKGGWLFDLNAVGQRIDGKDSQYAERGGDVLSRSSPAAQPYRNDYWLVDFIAGKRWGDYKFTASLGYARQYVFEQYDGVQITTSDNPVPTVDGVVSPDFVIVAGGNGMLTLTLTPAPTAAPSQTTPTPAAAPSQTASAPTAALTQANRIRMLTAETRLVRRGPNGTGWLIGLSLVHNEADVKRRMVDTMFSIPLTSVRNKVVEGTVYGEATFELDPSVTATFGGRLTRSNLSGRAEDAMAPVTYPLDPTIHFERSETRLLPSAALAYRPSDALTLFARFQQGFRPGGVAARRDFIQRFKGDRVSTIEAGMRYGSRALDLAVSASWTNWSDIQADLIDGFGFATKANVGDGRVLSFGLSGRWRPIAGLEFDAAIYLNDTKVTGHFTVPSDLILSFTPSPAPMPANTKTEPDTSLENFERLPNVADATGRVGFAYTTAINDRLQFQASGFARYVGKSTLGVGSILGQPQGNYVDTALEFRIGDRRRGISLTLTNLLDARGNRFALGSPFLVRDSNQITPLQPRTFRLGFDLAL